jgi:hypothetical protein
MRTRFHSTIAVFLSAVFAACSNGDDTLYTFKDGKSSIVVPFELNSNKIFVPVKIDGGSERWFIIDSGCPVTAIEMSVARELQLPIVNEREIAGAGEGPTQMGTTHVKSLGLDGLDWKPKIAWALAVNKPVSPFEGRRIDGLLGVDFLEQFVVRINYPERKIEIIQPTAFRHDGTGVTVPLEKRQGHFTVLAKLRLKGGQEIDGRFVVDIGVRLPLIVSTPFVNRHRLIDATKAGPMQTVGGGIGGETLARLARLESLAIGDLKISNPYVGLSQEQNSFLAADDTNGLLGAEIFRRYCLTLDFPGNRMFLAETRETGSSYEFDASGMFLIAKGADFHRYEVLSVVDGGPASLAGIKKGDLLIEVDATPTERMTLEQLRGKLIESGKSRELKLERNREVLSVKLQLRRQV